MSPVRGRFSVKFCPVVHMKLSFSIIWIRWHPEDHFYSTFISFVFWSLTNPWLMYAVFVCVRAAWTIFTFVFPGRKVFEMTWGWAMADHMVESWKFTCSVETYLIFSLQSWNSRSSQQAGKEQVGELLFTFLCLFISTNRSGAYELIEFEVQSL